MWIQPTGATFSGGPAGQARRAETARRYPLINGVYILSTGCQWRALPKDLPPRSTVHDYLGLWNMMTNGRVPRESRSQPHGLHHRGRKRGARIDSHGFDAGN